MNTLPEPIVQEIYKLLCKHDPRAFAALACTSKAMLAMSRPSWVRSAGGIIGLMDKWNSIPNPPYQINVLRYKFESVYKKYQKWRLGLHGTTDTPKGCVNDALNVLVDRILPGILDVLLERKGIVRLINRGFQFREIMTASDSIATLVFLMYPNRSTSDYDEQLKSTLALVKEQCPIIYDFWTDRGAIHRGYMDTIDFTARIYAETGIGWHNREIRNRIHNEFSNHGHSLVSIENCFIWGKYHKDMSPIEWAKKLDNSKLNVLVLENKYEENKFITQNRNFYDFTLTRTPSEAIETLVSGQVPIESLDVVIAKYDSITPSFMQTLRRLYPDIALVIYECGSRENWRNCIAMGATLAFIYGNQAMSLLMCTSGDIVSFYPNKK
jgi:hypothetical protein